MGKFEQNDVSAMRTKGQDLSSRWKEILRTVSGKVGFAAGSQILRQSAWWKTGKVGAIHIPGTLKKQRVHCVLKIQGTKPKTSEALMIQCFARENKSKIIRPPKLYEYLEWDDENQFEALILEEVKGDRVIQGRPAKDENLEYFFRLYVEYRENCRGKPWVEKPKKYSFVKQLAIWKSAVKKQAESDRMCTKVDKELVDMAISLLEKNCDIENFEFVHGHFQPGDLIQTESSQVVLFSNLFWSWRMPFYDAVFAYHWWMLGMEHVLNFDGQLLEEEREKWQMQVYQLPEVAAKPEGKRLLNLAFLERAVAAFEVDRFMLSTEVSKQRIVYEGIRAEITRLLKELE